jgi:hypothetical protein
MAHAIYVLEFRVLLNVINIFKIRKGGPYIVLNIVTAL